MKNVSRAWGQFKRVFEVLALGEMCFQGMVKVGKGWLEVLALGETCLQGMGAFEKGV